MFRLQALIFKAETVIMLACFSTSGGIKSPQVRVLGEQKAATVGDPWNFLDAGLVVIAVSRLLAAKRQAIFCEKKDSLDENLDEDDDGN